MSCERFTEAITDHACGAPIDERAAAHLAACTTCRRMFDQQKDAVEAMDAELRDALAITASPEFAVRVSVRVRNRRPALPAVARWWIGAAAAAAVATALYLGLGQQPPGGPIQQSAGTSLSTPVERQTPVLPPLVEAAHPTHIRRDKGRVAVKGPRINASVVKPVELEVIVPPDQARAIARLRELVNRGVLDDMPLPPPATAAELIIAPLHIPELVVPDAQTVDERRGGERE
jgi:ferredoxin